jgi:hypothetical protein
MDPKKRTPELTLIRSGLPAQTQLVEIAPGHYAAPTVHPADVPRFGLVKLMRQTDGTYLPMLRHHGQWRRCGEDLLKDTGLEAMSYRTFYRLVNAGFVKQTRPAPNVILVDLGSLVDHIEAAGDPEFWTPERRKRFMQADDWIGAKSPKKEAPQP